MNTVLYSSVFFCAAVVEFDLGVIESGMRETVSPVLVTCITYSKFLLSVNRCEGIIEGTDSAP